jgi:hypothetical protein
VISQEPAHRENDLNTTIRYACIVSPGVKRRRLKQLLLIIAGLVVAGCCSTQNELQRLSTSDLQLRRYELTYCLTQTRVRLDKQPVEGNASDDIRADLEEREAIEGEIARRDITAYHSVQSVTDQYARDRCHCQD